MKVQQNHDEALNNVKSTRKDFSIFYFKEKFKLFQRKFWKKLLSVTQKNPIKWFQGTRCRIAGLMVPGSLIQPCRKNAGMITQLFVEQSHNFEFLCH